MKGIFRTRIDEIEIIKQVLEYSNLIDFSALIEKDIYYRYKCKMVDLNNKKIEEKDYSKIAIEHSSKNVKFRRHILEKWAMMISDIVPKIEDADELNEEIRSHKEENNYTKENKFLFICYLWLKDNEKYNNEGDELYKLYKKSTDFHCDSFQMRKDETIDHKNLKLEYKGADKMSLFNEKEKQGGTSMDFNVKDDLMTLSIGELINVVISSKEDEVRLRSELVEKDKEIAKMKKQLDLMLDNRALKKELKISNKNVLELQSAIKKENEMLIGKVMELKKDNKQLLESIDKTKEYIKENVTNEIRREIKSKQGDMTNLLKSIVPEAINKNNKVIVEEIYKMIQNEITETNTKVDNEDDFTYKNGLQDNQHITYKSNRYEGMGNNTNTNTNTNTNKNEVKVNEMSNNQIDIEKIIEAIKG